MYGNLLGTIDEAMVPHYEGPLRQISKKTRVMRRSVLREAVYRDPKLVVGVIVFLRGALLSVFLWCGVSLFNLGFVA